MPHAHDDPLCFGRFAIDPARRLLLVDGQAIAIGARAFDLLLVLAQRRERVVGKPELLDLVWPGVVVEEHNIAAQISSLRKLLGAQVIATVPGRGYRFVADADAPAPAQPPDRAAALRHNLPEQRTRFIGRDTELAELARLVPQSRLLTLSGSGGSGKTRLALQLAKAQLGAFADGAWFVDLAPLRDAQRVAAACAAALGLDAPEPQLTERVAAHLAEREALVVLDNCEHVREGVAALVDAVLARAGHSRIVATSREALAVAGEQLYPVRALALPATPDLDTVRAADAVRVFADRARLVLPEFEVNAANAAAIAEICRKLDGIALAIELAAARVKMLSVDEIASRLEDRFRLLIGGNALVERQQTLLATMQWSYEQLGGAQQHMLRQVSTCVSGWTLDAATAIAGTADDYQTLALLSALYDKSLLMVEHGTDGTGGVKPRYHMLETVRQYAQARLAESGEAATARTHHAAFYLALAESAAPHLRGPEQPPWMARLRAEQENLVAALTWCAAGAADPRWGMRIAAATSRYWLFNQIDLGCRLAAAALQRDRAGADSAARFHTLQGLAVMHMHRGDAAAALAHAHAALAMARRQGEIEWQVKALAAIGGALSSQGEQQAALLNDREALRLAEASGNAEYIANLSNNIAEIERSRGELDAAERGYRRALHLGRAQGNLLLTAIVLHNLVRLCVAAGRHAQARAFAIESEQLLRSVGEDVLRFELLKVAASLAASLGEHARAVRWWAAGQARFTVAGYRDPHIDETQMAELLANSRRALGEAAYAAAEAAGQALDLDAAIRQLAHWLQDGAVPANGGG